MAAFAQPSTPFACPWCGAPASPAGAPQLCTACGKRCTIVAGPAADASIQVPPPHAMAPNVFVKWSIVVTYRIATLEPQGVTSGTLDPVIGMAAMDKIGIGYGDVVAVALWRRIAWPELVAGVLMPLPFALLSEYGAVLTVLHSHEAGPAAIFAGIGLSLGAFAAWLIYRGIIVGRRQARITGRYNQVIVAPIDKSPAFHAELFRRMGMNPPPIP